MTCPLCHDSHHIVVTADGVTFPRGEPCRCQRYPPGVTVTLRNGWTCTSTVTTASAPYTPPDWREWHSFEGENV